MWKKHEFRSTKYALLASCAGTVRRLSIVFTRMMAHQDLRMIVCTRSPSGRDWIVETATSNKVPDMMNYRDTSPPL